MRARVICRWNCLETRAITAFLHWQNVEYQLEIDEEENLRLSNGTGTPITHFCLSDHKTHLYGFKQVIDFFEREGLLLL